MNVPQESVARARVPHALRIVCALLLACAIAVACMPAQQAYALETAKCTAKPNVSGSSDVIGATETRITWEGQAADDESIVELSLTLPDGTDYGTDDLRVTLLTGDDLMTREVLEPQVSTDGQTLSLSFDEALVEGAYLRVEIYDVFFPRAGGELEVTGSYTLDDGTVVAIDDVPAIEVASHSVFEQAASWLEEQAWVETWNSVKFLKLFVNPPVFVRSLPTVFSGFLMAVATVLLAYPLAIPLGLALALMRISGVAVLRGLATAYVNIVRGTPLFLQIYIAFFGLPLAGVHIPSFPLGVIVLFMNSGAYQCEIFRGGIQSIGKGQSEAARSLGMNGAQTMFSVIIPQMVRRVIPTMTNEFILLFKDTSMLAAVGVMEIVMNAKTIVASTGSITPYVVAACFYLLVTLPLAKVVGMLEERLAGTPSKKRKKKRAGAALPATVVQTAEAAAAPEAADDEATAGASGGEEPAERGRASEGGGAL